MTDIRDKLFSFLDGKTAFTIINAMVQFTEPDTYVSFYVLNDDVESVTQGERGYNAIDDLIDTSYAPIPMALIQIDVRGTGSYLEAKTLYYGFQRWQNELKAIGLYFRGIGSISPIPNVQNGYVKEGYQFDLSLSYDTTVTIQVDYATSQKLIQG